MWTHLQAPSTQVPLSEQMSPPWSTHASQGCTLQDVIVGGLQSQKHCSWLKCEHVAKHKRCNAKPHLGSIEHRLSAAVLFPALQITARDMVPPPQVELQPPYLPTCRHMQQVLLMLGPAQICDSRPDWLRVPCAPHLPEHKIAWLRVARLAGCWHLSWALVSIQHSSIAGKALHCALLHTSAASQGARPPGELVP